MARIRDERIAELAKQDAEPVKRKAPDKQEKRLTKRELRREKERKRWGGSE